MTALPNTEFTYQYRDAANYKQSRTVVLAGRLTDAQATAIAAALDDGVYFIPSQVGLEDLQHLFGGLGEDDHVWHEAADDDNAPWLVPTAARPDAPITADDLARRFAAARWDVQATADALGMTA